MSSNWINKMNNLEETPPEKGWEKVATALDESMNGFEFPDKLYNSHVTPPSGVWSSIENELDADSTPIIPLRKKSAFPIFLRYAAAACIIGLIAFGAIRFFATSPVNLEQTATALPPKNTETITANPAVIEPVTQGQVPQLVKTDDETLEQSKHTYAKLDLSRKNSYNKLYNSPAQLASFASNENNSKQPEIQYSHRAAINDSPPEEADRYVMYRDTHGRFIRISKKLSELFCCVSGEVQDEKCTDQLKQWREKIASSPFNPSPDNFMDILDLINSIQDNRN
jgi:hypothetical protein